MASQLPHKRAHFVHRLQSCVRFGMLLSPGSRGSALNSTPPHDAPLLLDVCNARLPMAAVAGFAGTPGNLLRQFQRAHTPPRHPSRRSPTQNPSPLASPALHAPRSVSAPLYLYIFINDIGPDSRDSTRTSAERSAERGAPPEGQMELSCTSRSSAVLSPVLL